MINDKKLWNAPNLYSVLHARKRYESDLALVQRAVAEQTRCSCGLRTGMGMNDNLAADRQYMLLSNVICSEYGDKYSTSMYLQYALGIMRFMEDDIYDVLPKLFDYEQFINEHVHKSNNAEIHMWTIL